MSLRRVRKKVDYAKFCEEEDESTNNSDGRDELYKLTRPSVRVHWVACAACSFPGNFFQVGGSLRPFKDSPRSHTSRGPLAHRSSHVCTTKQILF